MWHIRENLLGLLPKEIQETSQVYSGKADFFPRIQLQWFI